MNTTTFKHGAAAIMLTLMPLLLGATVCTAQAADINITQFGAVPDDTGFDTEAIQAAIDAAGNGDRVVVPAGKFRMVTIWVKSNMTLYLSEGAVLESSDDWKDFGNPFRWDAGMIRARDNLNNFTIEGPGTIDGVRCYNPKGSGGYKGPHAIQLTGKGQSNIRISGIRIVGASNYGIYLGKGAKGVTIENVKWINCGSDGFHFNFATDVTVTNCDFRTADDCIAGVGNQNVKFLNCRFNSSCNGMRFSGKDVLVRDCEFVGPGEVFHPAHGGENDPRAYTMDNAICHFSSKDRKSPIPSDDWLIENCTVSGVNRLLQYTAGGHWQEGVGIRTMTFRNLTASLDKKTHMGEPVITARDIYGELRLIIHGADIAANPTNSAVIEIKDFDHLELRDVTLRIDGGRPAIRAVHGNTVWLDGVKTVPASNKKPFDLTDIRTLRETRVPVKR